MEQEVVLEEPQSAVTDISTVKKEELILEERVPSDKRTVVKEEFIPVEPQGTGHIGEVF